MLEDRLQLIVEQLAERLERSVIIDDSALRPLAVSAQLGRVDESRIEAVLQRRTSESIRAVITRHGVQQARDPMRIPANAELGTLGRLVIPLVDEGWHLGYLWLIDDPALTPEQLRDATACSEEATRLLGARAAQESHEADTARRLLDDLLRADPQVREQAAESMRDLEVLEERPPYVVGVVCAVAGGPGGGALAGTSADLRRIASDVRRRAGRHAVLCGAPRSGEFVLVTTEGARETVVRALRSRARGYVLGTRTGVRSFEAVRDAREDARYASEVAAAVARFDGTADWAGLGAYAAFQHLERTPESLERLCPGVSALWDCGTEMYEATVRAYLGHGGNVQKTAAALHIHRTTLYWRLANVERLLGLDLADGDARLRLHLALTFADLVPDLPAASVPAAAQGKA